MKFLYTYRTSDGIRRTDTIEAQSKDTVFAELRSRGIRAIKVEPVTNSIVKRQLFPITKMAVGGISITAVVISITLWFMHSSSQTRELQTIPLENLSVELSKLKTEAEALKSLHMNEMVMLDLDALRDYGYLTTTNGTTSLFKIIADSRTAIHTARARTRDLFKDIHKSFPLDRTNERIAAQRLYGEVMSAIDITEERIDVDETIIMLLDGNRGKWSISGDRMIFNSPALERSFRFLVRDLNSSAFRWRLNPDIDVSSDVVELPTTILNGGMVTNPPPVNHYPH